MSLWRFGTILCTAVMLVCLSSCGDDKGPLDECAYLCNVNYQDQIIGRYYTRVFENSTKSTGVYSSNKTLDNRNVDLNYAFYEPEGDSENNRPLVLVLHGGDFTEGSGSFLTGEAQCNWLVRLGYTCASIDYRGYAGSNQLDEESVQSLILRGVHDAKAAIRFFKKAAADQNVFGIDTTKIFLLGEQAGGTIALHAAYLNLDDLGDQPSFPSDSITKYGGLEGDGGHMEHTSSFNAVISISAGLVNENIIDINEPHAVFMGAEEDLNYPVGKASALKEIAGTNFEWCGARILSQRATEIGLNHRSLIVPCRTHSNLYLTPWNTCRETNIRNFLNTRSQ